MSETTAMIDVTATMLPSTVMNDRSLALQIAASATAADSKIRCTSCRSRRLPAAAETERESAAAEHALRVARLPDLDAVAVGEAADRVVRSGDHLIAVAQPAEHLEVLVAGDADFD